MHWGINEGGDVCAVLSEPAGVAQVVALRYGEGCTVWFLLCWRVSPLFS